MQKKIIALAVAGLVSGAAFAQSNVTVYGIADGYYGHVSASGGSKVNAINSGGLSGSRLGFKGAEDLGGGLKAVFEYEMNFNLDNTGNGTAINNASTGNALNGTRQSYVGLAGGFGTVVMGRLQTPGYYVGKFDALASSTISPQAILANAKMIGGAAGSTIAPNNNARLNNAAAYISPSFSGFSAVAAMALGEQATGAKEDVFGLGLNYANGPLSAGFIYHDINDYTNNAALDANEWLIGGGYDLGVVKLLGSYQRAKLDNTGANKLWQIGAVAPMGAGNIHFAYGKLKMDGDANDSKSWTLAYTHGLSKRTTAYAGYNRTSNESGAAMGLLISPTAGGRTNGLVAGVRHSF
jgi:predicted porin